MAVYTDKSVGQPISWGELGKAQFSYVKPEEKTAVVKVVDKLSPGDTITVKKNGSYTVKVGLSLQGFKKNGARFAINTNPRDLPINKKPNLNKEKDLAYEIKERIFELSRILLHPKIPDTDYIKGLRQALDNMIEQIGIIINSLRK